MKNQNLIILLISLVVAMMGYGLAMPVLLFYIDTLGDRGIHYKIRRRKNLFYWLCWAAVPDLP